MKTRILILTASTALLLPAAFAQKAPPAPPSLPAPGKATNAPATTTNRLELLRQKLAGTNAPTTLTNAPVRTVPTRTTPVRTAPAALGTTNVPTVTTAANPTTNALTAGRTLGTGTNSHLSVFRGKREAS